MVDSKGIPTGPSARRRGPLIAVILVVIVVIIGVLGYQSIADARLEDRISKVETSLESIGISLNSTLVAVSEVRAAEEDASGDVAYLRESLGELETSLTSLSTDIAAISQDSPEGLQQRLQGILNRTSVLESILGSLGDQVDDLGDTLTGVAQVEASYGSLNTTLNYAMTEIDNLEELVNSLTGTAPSRIYEEARNSVVVIRTNLGQGSGFFYAPDLILTNYHVIEGASSIEVEYYDRQRTQAFLVGGDPYADVAVIRVEMMRNISALTLANSSQALVGQQVIAIGNPLGLTGSLSLGYVAQVNKLTDIYPIIVPVLELDITIAPGSSRGPLLDLSGRVVGITNAGTGYGLNFAVPSNIVARAASSIQANGTYGHPYVGVQLVELTPDYINSNNINNIDPFQSGLMVTLVNPGTPAAEAGLQAAISGSEGVEARDIILAIDGHPILTFEDWAAYVEEQISPGETMLVELWRYGTTVTIPITPTRRPPYEE